MKIICDCGNEMEFIMTGNIDDEDGEYVKFDYNKFELHGEHDQVWITCEKCKKAIWMFT